MLKVFAMPNIKVLLTIEGNFNLGLKVIVYHFYYAFHKIGKCVADFLLFTSLKIMEVEIVFYFPKLDG